MPMLTCYCPHATCAARVSYETIKPTACPQCRKTFASAFVVAPAPVAPSARATVADDDSDDRPLGRAALAAQPKSATVTKARLNRPEPSRLMNAPASEQPVFPDDGADDEGEEALDPREVRRQARALASTIDTSSIKIADQDEGVFSFRDMWDEGAAAREKAAKSPAKVAKRKARR